MKKKTLIILTIVIMLALTACTVPTLPEETPDEFLERIVEEFREISSVAVSGKIFKDGILTSEIIGTVDDGNKKIALNENGFDYLYCNKYLIKSKEDKFFVEKTGTSFNATLAMLPFSLYHFTYNVKNRGEIYRSGDQIILTFLDKGVKNTFSSTQNVSGGVFSVSTKNGVITDTVLTTELTENGKNVAYSLHYSYKTGGGTFDTLPWVTPSDTLNYALYAVNTMALLHENKTLHTASGNYNTGVLLGAIILDTTKIKNVFVINLEDLSINLNIVYTEKVMIVGLSSSVEEIQITYDTNFNVSAVTINGGTKYYLK